MLPGPRAVVPAVVVAVAIAGTVIAVRHPSSAHVVAGADPVHTLLGPGWTERGNGAFGAENLSVMSEEGRRFVRVRYPAGSASPTVTRSAGRPVGGAQLYAVPRLP